MDPLVAAILLIAIGVLVLLLGSRLVILGAGIGLLLGFALLRFLPGTQSVLVSVGIPVALAVVCALGAGFIKGIVEIITLVIGALAGAAIVLSVLDLFGWSGGGFIDVLLAVIGAVVGVVIIGRFKDFAVLILAGLVGALLTTRGLEVVLPSLVGAIGTIIFLVLAAFGVAYQGGYINGKKQVTQV